jgi:excinuclease ABC subunit C
MTLESLKLLKLPDSPGVYRFVDKKGAILYIGKATSLASRVRSYFANDLMHTRGKHIVDMVTLSHTVVHTITDSVLDAVVLEASLIKRHQPHYNTKEKDNKSWNYVVISKDVFPSISSIRERTMVLEEIAGGKEWRSVFGPFPSGSNLPEALAIVRKILPFRTSCTPKGGKPCFDFQIGLCPGVCIGAITIRDYEARVSEIELFFGGNKDKLLEHLTTLMMSHAKNEEFEIADTYKRRIFALTHINDASLITHKVKEHSLHTSSKRGKPFRIEAYDIAHLFGTHTVGVMTVTLDGKPKKGEYRKFKIRTEPERVHDTLHLQEVLERRFRHPEWQSPDLLVIDGSVAQRRTALRVLASLDKPIPVVAVVKDEGHKPKAILGNKELVASYKRWILVANAESHRFAVDYHRTLRDRMPK